MPAASSGDSASAMFGGQNLRVGFLSAFKRSAGDSPRNYEPSGKTRIRRIEHLLLIDRPLLKTCPPLPSGTGLKVVCKCRLAPFSRFPSTDSSYGVAYPNSFNFPGLSGQFLLSLTCSERYTLLPRRRSILILAFCPTFFSIAPFFPITMLLCDSFPV